MVFNENKFVHLNINPGTSFNTLSSYNAHNKLIQTNDKHRDLGIEVSSDIKFKTHITNQCIKARNKAMWILRTFKTREAEHLITLLKSMIIPQLEYCVQMWSPVEKGQILQIEGVQRYFTSKMSISGTNNYWDRLKKLNIYSLQRRRERYLVIYTWKILEGLAPNPAPEYFKTSYNSRRGRNINKLSYKAGSTVKIRSIRHNSFFVRGPRLFNSLPKNLRDITDTSVESFKGSLDKFLKKIPDEPPVYGANWSNSVLDWKGRGGSPSSLG